jgi:hypothetical protein
MGDITSRKEKCSICGTKSICPVVLIHQSAMPVNMLESIPSSIRLCARCLEDDYELELAKEKK